MLSGASPAAGVCIPEETLRSSPVGAIGSGPDFIQRASVGHVLLCWTGVGSSRACSHGSGRHVIIE